MMKLTKPPLTRARKATLPKNTQQNIVIKKPANKSVENKTKRRTKQSLSILMKQFNMTQEHMGCMLEQQKKRDLITIKGNVATNHYYETLMSLFMLLYSSSQIIASNIFDCRKQTTGLSGLKYVGFAFSIYQHVWNQRNLAKLRNMAKNMLKMGKTPKIFEQKIQFVCRKISLNMNMRKRIEMAFLNTRLKSMWQKVISKIKMTQDIEIIEQMYELAPQKMAYWDFTYFVNNYMTTEQFYSKIKRLSRQNQQQCNSSRKNSQSHSFTYEFQLIEIFCFHEQNQVEQQKLEKQKLCQLI